MLALVPVPGAAEGVNPLAGGAVLPLPPHADIASAVATTAARTVALLGREPEAFMGYLDVGPRVV
jgi:hypothetical protein